MQTIVKSEKKIGETVSGIVYIRHYWDFPEMDEWNENLVWW